MKKKKPRQGKVKNGIAKALQHPAFHQRVKPGKGLKKSRTKRSFAEFVAEMNADRVE